MNNFCIIVFGKQINRDFAFTLGLISLTPIEDSIKTDNSYITTFKTDKTIQECRNELSVFDQSYFIIDITESKEHIFSGMGKPAYDALSLSELTDDDREKFLLHKYKTKGVESLTEREKEFLEKRF